MKSSVLGAAVLLLQKNVPSAVHASASECKNLSDIFSFQCVIVFVKMLFALSAFKKGSELFFVFLCYGLFYPWPY